MSLSSLAKQGLLALPPATRRCIGLFGRALVGIAEDFWNDGHWEKLKSVGPTAEPQMTDDGLGASVFKKAEKSGDSRKLWHALPGEVSEKMWGEGSVTPADDYITDLLIKPLSLTKDMSMLDLAAGLGRRMKRTTEQFGAYISGREPDPEVAARAASIVSKGKKNSHFEILPYDPLNFSETRKYDCIVARETIYRVADKAKFIKSIVNCCKSGTQVSFTDYIVNPEVANQPAILAWKAFETGATPLSLVEMAELWAKNGISLRVHDDQTEYYTKEVKKGLVAFAQFVTSVRPDAETKKAIEKRITTWAHRVAAMEQGMRFFRFYGLK